MNLEVTGDLGESTLSRMVGEKAKVQWVESECVVLGHLGGSGHDLMVHKFKPHNGLSAVSAEHALDPLFPSLSAPPPLTVFLKNKYLKFFKKKCVMSK